MITQALQKRTTNLWFSRISGPDHFIPGMCIILPQSSHYQAVNTALKLWLRSAAEIVIRHRVKSHSIEAKHGSASRLSRALLYLNDGFAYIDFCDIHRNYPFQSNTPFTFESDIDVSISGASILLMCVLLIPIFLQAESESYA